MTALALPWQDEVYLAPSRTEMGRSVVKAHKDGGLAD